MIVDSSIKTFAQFLNKSWDLVQELLKNRDYTTDSSSISDWLQANWELLVERKILNINEYLEVYDEGADFYGISSRITDINALPTHTIIAKLKDKVAIDILNNQKISDDTEFIFDRLVGFKNNYYTEYPEFLYALLFDATVNIERVICLDNIHFEVVRL
jgi:hypothetical protein